MKQPFVLALVGLTSVGAYLVGANGLGLSGSGLRKAVGKMVECFGMMLVFFVVNLAAGMIAILTARVLTRGLGRSTSLPNETATLLVFSLLQDLAFQWWRELSRLRAR